MKASQRFIRSTLFLAASLALCGTSAYSDTLNASADVRTLAGAPDNNHSGNVDLSLYNNGGNTQRTWLNFDLSAYIGKTVTSSATLTLKANTYEGGYPDLMGVSIGTADAAWTLTGITWNNSPNITPLAGAVNPSGSYNTDDLVTWTIPAAAVQGWIDNGYNGLAITSGEGSTLHFYSSRNGGTPTLTFTAEDNMLTNNGVWTSASSGNWTVAANWQDNKPAYGVDRSATFNGATGVTVALDTNSVIGSLLFDTSDFVIAGPYALGLITSSGTPSVSVGAGRTATVSAAILGTQGLSKTGAGTLTLSGANARYSGGITVDGGILKADHDQALGVSDGLVTVAGGASLDLNGKTLQGYSQPFRLAGAGADAALGALGNNGGVNMSAIRSIELTADAAIGGNGGRWDIGRYDFTSRNTHIFGNNHVLTKVGGCTLAILAASTGLSGFVIDGGRVTPHQNNSFNDAPVTVNASGELTTWGGIEAGSHGGAGLTLASAITLNGGKITAVEGFRDTYTGGILLTNGGTLRAESGDIFVDCAVGGDGWLTKNGNNMVYLSGANSYNGGTAVFDGGALALTGSGSISRTNNLTVGWGGTFQINDTASAVFSDLNIGDWSGSSGHVQQSGGTVSVTGNSGEGAAVRLGHWPNETSTYTLAGGMLNITGGNLALGTDGEGIFTQTDGVLEVPGIAVNHRNSTGNGVLNLEGGVARIGAGGLFTDGAPYAVNLGGGTLGALAPWVSSLDMTLTGTGGSARFDTAGGNIVLAGVLSGGGGLVKNGAGTLALVGPSATYGGDTVITDGTLSLSAVAGASRHFDASTLSLADGAAVTQWDDLSGNGANATVPGGNANPTFIADAGTGTGLPAIAFARNGGAATSGALVFNRDTNVRSVFAVFKGSGFLMTDTNSYALHRPGNDNAADPLLANYGQINYLGSVYVNGAAVNPQSDPMPTSLHNGYNLVEVVGNGAAFALDSFNKDRVNIHAGNQSHAETLVFDFVVSEERRVQIEAYLNKKWFGFGGGYSVTNVLPVGTSVTLAGSGRLDLGNTVQTVAGLSGTGTVTNGLLTATGLVQPGGAGTIGTLTVPGGAALTGTLRVDATADGACDTLAVQGPVNLSGAVLAVAESAVLNRSHAYTVLTCSGTPAPFASESLPPGWHASYRNGSVKLANGGTLFFIY